MRLERRVLLGLIIYVQNNSKWIACIISIFTFELQISFICSIFQSLVLYSSLRRVRPCTHKHTKSSQHFSSSLACFPIQLSNKPGIVYCKYCWLLDVLFLKVALNKSVCKMHVKVNVKMQSTASVCKGVNQRVHKIRTSKAQCFPGSAKPVCLVYWTCFVYCGVCMRKSYSAVTIVYDTFV